jgi:ATP-dependent protease ClpP protease subunit
VFIVFDAEISQVTAEGLLAAAATCATNNVKKVSLAICTSGGDVTQGIAIYKTLRAMPFELTTYNVGNVDSIKNAVFLAGEKRYAAKHSTRLDLRLRDVYVPRSFMEHSAGCSAQR